MKIAVLKGGESAEREVSLKSAKSVVKNLDKEKYEILEIDIRNDLKFVKKILDFKPDVAFIIMHGPGGEDGKIQGFLKSINIPYTGSNVLASALAMDKLKFKQVINQYQIKTARHDIALLDNLDEIKQKYVEQNNYPFIVKPAKNGSSYGISLAKNYTEFLESLETALNYDDVVLIEEYLGNKEFTVPTIGNKSPIALPVIEIIPPAENDFFDYKAKYSGVSQEIVPAEIDNNLTNHLQKIAINVHKIIGCRGLCRTDFILKDNKPYVLEVNTIPGMTSESLAPKSAQAFGWSYSQLLDQIINLALK